MGVAKPSQMRLRGKGKPSLGPSRDVGSICRKYLPHLPPQAWWQHESVHRWLLTWLANPPPCSGICNTGAELPGCSLRPAGWDICHCFSVYSIAANVGFNCSDCSVLRTVPRGPTYPGRSVLWLSTSQCFLGQIYSLAVLFWCQGILLAIFQTRGTPLLIHTPFQSRSFFLIWVFWTSTVFFLFQNLSGALQARDDEMSQCVSL